MSEVSSSKNQLCVHGRCDECPECVTEGAMQAIYAQPRETPTHNVGSLLDRLLAEYKADPRGMMWTEWLVEQVSIQMRERQTLAEAFKRRAPETSGKHCKTCRCNLGVHDVGDLYSDKPTEKASGEP